MSNGNPGDLVVELSKVVLLASRFVFCANKSQLNSHST